MRDVIRSSGDVVGELAASLPTYAANRRMVSSRIGMPCAFTGSGDQTTPPICFTDRYRSPNQQCAAGHGQAPGSRGSGTQRVLISGRQEGGRGPSRDTPRSAGVGASRLQPGVAHQLGDQNQVGAGTTGRGPDAVRAEGVAEDVRRRLVLLASRVREGGHDVAGASS